MTHLKELQKQAKERGIKGYSTMRLGDLQLALQGKRVLKKLKRNQVCVPTQTDFPVCNECSLKQYINHLKFKADANQRAALHKVVYNEDMMIDVETSAVLGYEIDYSRC